MGKSGYLDRQQQKIDNYIHSTEHLTRQYMVDTLQIAINREFGFGYSRIMRLCDTWSAVRQEFKSAMSPRDPLCDVAQDHMDRELLQIINGNQELIPFEERYAEMKKVRYGR